MGTGGVVRCEDGRGGVGGAQKSASSQQPLSCQVGLASTPRTREPHRRRGGRGDHRGIATRLHPPRHAHPCEALRTPLARSNRPASGFIFQCAAKCSIQQPNQHEQKHRNLHSPAGGPGRSSGPISTRRLRADAGNFLNLKERGERGANGAGSWCTEIVHPRAAAHGMPALICPVTGPGPGPTFLISKTHGRPALICPD